MKIRFYLYPSKFDYLMNMNERNDTTKMKAGDRPRMTWQKTGQRHRTVHKAFALFTIALVITIPTMSVTGETQQNQGKTIKYYEYKNDLFTYRAEILSSNTSTITLRETYYNSTANIKVSFTNTYSLNDRKCLNPASDNYLWIWITPADLTKDSIQASDKTLTITETTPTYYILTYHDAAGNQGSLYYNRNTLILEKTIDHVQDKCLSTQLISTGLTTDEGTNTQNPVQAGQVSSPSPDIHTLGTTTYYPPYYSAYGDKYSYSEGPCNARASWSASYTTGAQYNYCWVDSSGFLSRGIAQSWAWVTGPSGGKFSCTKSGAYQIKMQVNLYGATYMFIINAGWAGTGYAAGKNILYGYLYDYDTGYIAGTTTNTLFDGSAVPTNYRVWNNVPVTLTYNVNLFSGHRYYFKTLIYGEFRAGSIGIGGAHSETGLTATLQNVKTII